MSVGRWGHPFKKRNPVSTLFTGDENEELPWNIFFNVDQWDQLFIVDKPFKNLLNP